MVGKFIFTALVFFSMTVFAAAQEATTSPTPKPEPKKSNARPSVPSVAATAGPDFPPEPYDKADAKTMAGMCVTLDTEAGAITLEMYPEHAPESVRNFLNMAAAGLLDSTTFSRVVPNFVIQGGDLFTGEKRPVYLGKRSRRVIPDEPNRILHTRGVLSMARADEPNSATTHFFILLMDAEFLDNKFAAFGRVTSGMDAVTTINKAPTNQEKPDKPVKIKKANVAACARAAVQ